MESFIPRYVEALCREMELVSASLDQRIPVHTLFFGGGTPSLLPIPELARILQTAARCFDLQPAIEASLEANPGTVSLEYLRDLHALGVNRLSLGMQSANPEELRLLTRIHDVHDVIQAVAWARRAGFNNLSVDLIFGLPGQTLERWQKTLEMAVGLNTQHLSLYALTVEKGTPLFRWTARGLVDVPDDDRAADMYEYTMQRLDQAGFVQYEISNWARPRPDGSLFAARHNLQYWYNWPYLGLGAGAHGFAGGKRTANVNAIRGYIERVSTGSSLEFPRSPANSKAQAIDAQVEMSETMMVGLRLTQEGVSDALFSSRFGQTLDQAYSTQIRDLTRKGLLEWAEEGERRLRLTKRGRLLGNQVFVEFV
jgi:oxygen-independent coproporphyrinogen-3 oxidase